MLAEAWEINAPIYTQVRKGETLTFADKLYPITRHGPLEDAWFTLCYSPLRDEDDAIAGILVTVFETTQQHVAEAAQAQSNNALRESKERQTFLLHLSDALRPLTDPIAIQETASRLLGEYLHTDRAYYVEINYERQVAIVARDYIRGNVPSLVGEHPLAAFSAVLEPQSKGRPFVCIDAATDPLLSDDDRQAYRERALRAFITVPIIKGGRLVLPCH